MRRLLLVLTLLLALPVPSAHASVSDLPEDGPAALYAAEPAFPAAPGWPGSEGFSRTSGTGRYDHGAFLWTDWLYDDHGAITIPIANIDQTAGSPSFGGFSYSQPKAFANGADLFRAGVMLRGGQTYFRVDWTTLVDPSIPMAVWAFDTDDNASTGTSAWPASAGVSSPGLETALIMSSHGAKLVNASTQAVIASAPVTVSTAAHSFVTHLPLSPAGTWRMRLVSGVSNAAGTALAPAGGALPGQTAVYNATFRDRAEEPVSNSFWDDMTQTSDLTSGSVTAFSQTLAWNDLASGRTTPEPRPTGWLTRWYVSAVHLGEGVLTSPATIEDGRPNFLGRLLPYSVYVPAGLPAKAPLTWLLHSFTQNHNQYAATTPSFVRAACESRHSLCVTTGGRGGDGWYVDEAQLDFWQVWHAVADHWTLDPDRTVISGYSMGGIGSNYLSMAHPDLFARVVTMAGAIGDVPELENLRWAPVYQAGGAADELVPVPVQKAESDRLISLGYRNRWLLIPGTDHVAYELQDSFDDAVAFMGSTPRATSPAHVTFRWSPKQVPNSYSPSNALSGSTLAQTQRPDLGVGTTGAYWLRSLSGRPGVTTAHIDAVSSALRAPAITPVRSTDTVVGGTTPGVVTQQTWTLGAAPTLRPKVALSLAGVRQATVLLLDAGLPASGCSTLVVTSDGAASVVLQGKSGAQMTASFGSGTHTLTVLSSATAAPRVTACTPPAALRRRADGTTVGLAATGPSTPLIALGLVLLATAGRARRRLARGAAARR